MIAFPNIDPVALHIGSFSLRWYALAYIAGVLLGWQYARTLAKQNPSGPRPEIFDDVTSWIILGVLLGGRIGYVLFYNLPYFLENPIEIPMVWKGGMSFHGGLTGVLFAMFLFCRKKKLRFFALSDVIGCAVPIGLFFGRIANFVNGELYGRVTDVSWAMVFPHGGPEPRHPSQLYHAALEGILLFIIMAVLAHQPKLRGKEGFLSGIFLILYALFRAFVEFFREPDIQLGFLFGGITMGQLLCIPMALFGIFLILRSAKKHDAA
jgi:phosphatidylglycerol:prolipoprotein diacylglycerol transferase